MHKKQILPILAILLFVAAAFIHFNSNEEDFKLIKTENTVNNNSNERDMNDKEFASEHLAVFTIIIVFAIGLIADKIHKKIAKKK